MSTTETDSTTVEIPIDESELPPKIRQNHEAGDPWWEHKGEVLFREDLLELVRDRVHELSQEDYGAYSPRNRFRETTKIRTKDREEFEAAIDERFKEHDQEFSYLMADRLLKGIDIHKEGPQRTDVWFDPSFGRPVGLGGADYHRERIVAEILRYECEVLWENVIEPTFEEFNEKYPY